MFATDSILPPDPDGLDVLHDREYRVRSYKLAADRMLIRGAIRDQKPPGTMVPDDPDPLTMHHMIVELEVAFPALQITAADVIFDAHPHSVCPVITEHYKELVGLSIARGFTHEVRQRFGGPNGCTHTTALLLAMGPVAVQSMWSMNPPYRSGNGSGGDLAKAREQVAARNLNTCHVWAEDGEYIAAARSGERMEVPITIKRRLDDLGIPVDRWQR